MNDVYKSSVRFLQVNSVISIYKVWLGGVKTWKKEKTGPVFQMEKVRSMTRVSSRMPPDVMILTFTSNRKEWRKQDPSIDWYEP